MLKLARAEARQDLEAARGLMRELTTWAIALDPDAAAKAPTFEGLDAELAALPGPFGPPDGCLLLARVEEAPVGCVAFQAHGGGVVELKRMYVRAGHRGMGKVGP